MKKGITRTVLATLLFFIAIQATAGPVDYETAKDIAEKYINSKNGVKKSIKHKSFNPKRANGTTTAEPAYYIFDIEDNEGFVVVSGDDRLKPILAHTDNGSFESDSLNPAVRWWLNAMEESVAELRKSSSEKAYNATSYTTGVEPLITTKWDQYYPYNALCPYDTEHSDLSLTGCTATALAQVLNYYEFPDKGTGNISYTTEAHGMNIEENLEDYTFDWENMLDSYNAGSTAEQDKSVAELMYACGVAINSDYCYYTTWSSTSSCAQALTYNFGYKGVDHLTRDLFTHKEWNDIIINELDNARPVLYRGENANGGHIFVCDGYNAEGLFHINWGWGGYLDGYFELASMDYCIGQYAICGIDPQKDQPSYNNTIKYSSFAVPTELNYSRSNIFVQLLQVENMALTSFTGYYGLAITKNEDIVAYTLIDWEEFLKSGYFYHSFELSMNIPDEIPDGEYKLVGVYKATNDDEVKFMQKNNSNGVLNHLIVTLNGDNATLSLPESYQPAALEVTSIECLDIICSLQTTEVKLKLKLKNNTATEFEGIVFINDSRNYQGVYIPANEEKECIFEITVPENNGKILNLDIYSRDNTTETLIKSHNWSISNFAVDSIYYVIANEKEKSVYVTYSGNTYYEVANEYSGEVTIPSTVTYEGITYNVKAIGNNAFRDCKNLTGVVIPESVTSIGSCAFEFCSSLTRITGGENIRNIGAYAFQYCDIEDLHIPSSLEYIGDYAFTHNYRLKSITVSSDNKTYTMPEGSNVLIRTASNSVVLGINKVVIPEGIRRIENGAFNGIRTITSITIPASLQSIGNWAFDACDALQDVYISNLTVWCNIEFYNKYSTPMYCANNLYLNGEKITDLVIPSDISYISPYSFSNCTNIASVTIPNGITHIGESAFMGCTKLKTVYNLSALDIVKGATTHGDVARHASIVHNYPGGDIVGEFVFTTKDDGRHYLTAYKGSDSEISLPDNYQGENYCIGDEAFRNNTIITSITIPASVTNIGECAFDGCTALKNIYVQGSVPALLSNDTFAGIYESATLYVPAGTKAAYLSSTSQRKEEKIKLCQTNCNDLQNSIKSRNEDASYETVQVYTQNPDVKGTLNGNDYFFAYQPTKTKVSELPKATFGVTGTHGGRYKIALVTAPWFIQSYSDTICKTTDPQYADSYLKVRVSQNNEQLAMFPCDSFNIGTSKTNFGIWEEDAIVPDRSRIDTIFLKDTEGEDYIFDLKHSGNKIDGKSNSVDVNIELVRPLQYNERNGRYTSKNANNFAFRFLLDQIILIPVDDSLTLTTTYWNKFANIAEYNIGLAGDVDGDGTVDVADVTTIVSIILGNDTENNAADVDGDGTVDVADVTTIVSIILTGK